MKLGDCGLALFTINFSLLNRRGRPVCLPASSGGAIFHSPGWSDRVTRKPLAFFWGGVAEPRVKRQTDDDFGLIPHSPVMKTEVFMTGE